MTNKTKIAILFLTVITVLSLCVVGLCNTQKNIILRIAYVSPPGFPYDLAAKKFKADVENETKGRISVQLYGGGQLGGERDTIEAMQMGTLEGVLVANAVLSAWNKKAMLWDMPFLFRDYHHAVKAINSKIELGIVKDLEKVGISELGAWIGDYRNVYTKNKPIYTPDDLKGIKIRVMENPVQIDTFNALGAIATPMNYNELYSALQQGVVDAAENSTSSFWVSKHYEVCKYYSFTGHFFTPAHFLIAKKFYDSLPSDLNAIVKRLGADASGYAGDVSRKGWDTDLENIKKAGVKVNEVKAKAAFQKKVKVVYQKYNDVLGDLIKQVSVIK
jgi:tripartite ATP-independent transporter DctP family solute receptor